jgi:hypothetical protein
VCPLFWCFPHGFQQSMRVYAIFQIVNSSFGKITAQDVGLFVGVLLIFLMFAGVLIALAELRLGWMRRKLLKVCVTGFVSEV